MKNHKVRAAVVTAALAVTGAVVWSGAASSDEGAAPKAAATSNAPAAAGGNGRVTQPLRDEHKELIPHIAALAAAGDAVGVAPRDQQIEQVHASYEFLSDQLIPHAVAEDKVLYPVVDRLIGVRGTTHATDTMRRDHTEVGTLTEELGALGGKLEKGALTTKQQDDLRRVLYSLNGVVGLHFAKEEEVYLPLLDRELTAEQARQLFEEMEQVTKSAGGDSHQH